MAGQAFNEDAAVVSVPPGMALVQTVDVLAPIVNDARAFGRIAAANALSDVYAMGGRPWCVMSLAFFPPELALATDDTSLADIIAGSREAMLEAGAVSAGGHTVQDDELKYGLAVTGIIDPAHIARNNGLVAGQKLILTKPLGVGILATAVKADWQWAAESEAEITNWCGRLNSGGAEVIRQLGLGAATDITGFGIGGHAQEMARASGVCVKLCAHALPLFPHTLEYARDGLIPAGSHANARHFLPNAIVEQGVSEALASIIYDAQTSGGLLLAVPPEHADQARHMLLANGDLAAEVGEVLPKRADGKELVIAP